MSLSARRQALARIHGGYQPADRPRKTPNLDELLGYATPVNASLGRPAALEPSRCQPCPDIPHTPIIRPRAEHRRLDPFAIQKILRPDSKRFLLLLSNVNRETTQRQRLHPHLAEAFRHNSPRRGNESVGIPKAMARLFKWFAVPRAQPNQRKPPPPRFTVGPPACDLGSKPRFRL